MSLAIDLRSSVPTPIRERGAAIYASGMVTIREGNAFEVEAQVRGSQLYDVILRREDDDIVSSCSCPYFDSEGNCKHVWATLMAADRKGYLLGSSGRRAQALVEAWIEDDPDFDDDEDDFELRPPAPVPPRGSAPKAPPVPQWQQLIGQLAYEQIRERELKRVDREIYYALDIGETYGSGIHIEVLCRERKKDGQWGKLKSGRISRDEIAQMSSEVDRDLLSMLGGTPVIYDWSNRESIPSSYQLDGAMVTMMLPRLCATGRCRLRRQRDETLEQLIPLSWDDGPAWKFRLKLEPEGDSWTLRGEFMRENQEPIDAREPVLIHREGVLAVRGSLARFEGRGTLAWAKLLRRTGPIKIPVKDAEQFLLHMLNQPELPPIDWPEQLRYTESTPELRPLMRIENPEPRRKASDATLCAYVAFGYGDAILPAAEPVAGLFDPKARVLLRRDRTAEQTRINELGSLGFKFTGLYESEPHYHLAAKKLPVAVRDLIAKGWHVEIDGRAFRKPVEYRAELTSGVDWFELRAEVDYGSARAELPDLLKAIKQKSNLVELTDGSLGVIPEELIQQYGALLGLGKLDTDHVRYSRSQAALLDALLASRPAIRVDEAFQRAREQLRSFERIVPAEQPAAFNGELRNYQCEGLAWMRFMQDLGFGGCLADDMGLGKTAQVLAVLEQRRALREAGEPIGPSLAVVPRSIVFNWKQEAERFTPKLRVLDHSGIERSRNGSDFSKYDLVLTTYGTLRRDIAKLQDVEFDYAILDEAQAIKNSASDSAKCARLLRATHRLAMSGTPIENHLGELYSLFEFLNPGMLGSMSALSLGGISLRNPDEATRQMLAMAVRPFLLRRTKQQVARELPPRTEQTIYCELDSDERKSYNELRNHYRSALLSRIAQEGMAKSQMHVLEALLRLRQAACHPGLLDTKRKDQPSAKIEALQSQLAEVLSEGHKALVFSQFTSLLDIVRKQLDREDTVYEYLDGSTRDRQARVERFQTDPECKLFLISLKAGGLGLNLTAAEYVFLLDPWWNPAVEAQAIDRAHRIGQFKQVFAYRLIARDTVEEKVLELQSRKRDLAEAIIRADASLVRDLKREDLEFLLS